MYTLLIFFVCLILLLAAIVVILKLFLDKADEQVDLFPYRAKQYLFSRSEHEFLRALQEHIDTKRYMIFPKVRLADFIEVTARGKEYQGPWNKIRSKHVDFLVWDVQNNKIALAIELDGKSHNSEKMRVRDAFVNKLYERVNLQMKRIQASSDMSSIASQVSNLLNI